MKKVRAKFRVTQINKELEGEKTGMVKLEPVIDGSEENKKFFRYTPAGLIQMFLAREETLGAFKLNQELYVDFIPVESE